MIPQAMYGNGAPTLGMVAIKAHRLMAQFGAGAMKTSECCVAVRGTTTRGTPVPLAATGTPRSGGSATTAFGCRPWRGLVSPLPFGPIALCPFEVGGLGNAIKLRINSFSFNRILALYAYIFWCRKKT